MVPFGMTEHTYRLGCDGMLFQVGVLASEHKTFVIVSFLCSKSKFIMLYCLHQAAFNLKPSNIIYIYKISCNLLIRTSLRKNRLS